MQQGLETQLPSMQYSKCFKTRPPSMQWCLETWPPSMQQGLETRLPSMQQGLKTRPPSMQQGLKSRSPNMQYPLSVGSQPSPERPKQRSGPCWGRGLAQEPIAQRQAEGRPPAPGFTCWPLEKRPRDRGTPPLAPLPGSPYGMVSAHALGSSSWISRTLSMDFWAWDRACLAKLESWEALNQLISPPQPPALAAEAAPSGKAKGQADGRGPGGGCRESLACFSTRRGLSAGNHDPEGLPRARDVSLGASHTAETTGSNCAGAGCFHVHNRQLREPSSADRRKNWRMTSLPGTQAHL